MKSPTGTLAPVRFNASLLINNRQYPLLLVSEPATVKEIVVPELESVEQLHQFYADHAEVEPEQLEELVFADDARLEAFIKHCAIDEPSTVTKNYAIDEPSTDTKYNAIDEQGTEFIKDLLAARMPHQKYQHLRNLITRFSSPDSGTDTLLPRLTHFLEGSVSSQLITQLAFVRECLHGKLMSGEVGFVLTTFEAALEHLRSCKVDKASDFKESGENGINPGETATANNIEPTSSTTAPLPPPPASTSITTPLTSLLYSSLSVVTGGRFHRPSKSPKTEENVSESNELSAFRERMMACNSAADLSVRDLNPLLEDYKNLLYMLLKDHHE